MTYIGKIIRTERLAQRINLSMLAEGLCSVSTLSRIETGECFASIELTKELLSRVGKSADKLELVVPSEEYKLEERKGHVLELADKKDLKQMKKEIGVLRKQIREDDYVNRRFLKEMQIVFQLLSGKRIEQLGEDLRDALSETVQVMDVEEIGQYCFSIEELKLWYLIVLSEKGTQEDRVSIYILNRIKRAMEERKWDDEEKVKLYPYVVATLCELYAREEKWDYVLEDCDMALKLLRENKRTSCILQIMRYKLIAMDQRGRSQTEEYRIYQNYVKAWEIVEEVAGFCEEGILSIFQRSGGADYFLLGEMVKRKRQQFQLTQAGIGEKINCGEEYISRLENGKKNISKKRYEKLADSLQMQKEKAQGEILTCQYGILEKRRKVAMLIQDGKYERAYDLLGELRKQIDLSIAENKQDLLCLETIILRRQKKILDKEALENFIQALQLTIKQYPNILLEKCIFKKTEVTLLNNIASCYGSIGNIEKAAQILRDTLVTYTSSKIDISNHCRMAVLLMFNYAKYMGLLGENEMAAKYCRKAVQLNIKSGRGNGISMLLYTLGWNLNAISQDTALYKKYCFAAYYISDLMIEKQRQDEIVQLYIKNSGEELILESE